MAEKDLVLTSFKDDGVLEDDKIKLKARVSDFESENLNMDLNIDRGQSIIAEKTELYGACSVTKVLEKWKKRVEIRRATYRALTREKEKDMAYLKELVFAKEKADALGIVMEKERVITLEQDDEINCLNQELKTAREKAVKDVADLKEKIRAALAKQEEVNVSLKEELKFARKNESAVCKIENLYASFLKEKPWLGVDDMEDEEDMTSEIENFKSIESEEKSFMVTRGIVMTDGEYQSSLPQQL